MDNNAKIRFCNIIYEIRAKFSAGLKGSFFFALNLKSAIGHYDKIGNAFGYDDEENSLNKSIDDTVYTVKEEPKVTMSIKKVHRWDVGISFNKYYEGGVVIKKDSSIYLKDLNKVDQFYKEKNERIKQEARDDFKQRN